MVRRLFPGRNLYKKMWHCQEYLRLVKTQLPESGPEPVTPIADKKRPSGNMGGRPKEPTENLPA